MVWAPAAHGCELITTEAAPMDSLPWTKKARQTKDNLDRPELPYDRVDAGRGRRSSCERPKDLRPFSTQAAGAWMNDAI